MKWSLDTKNNAWHECECKNVTLEHLLHHLILQIIRHNYLQWTVSTEDKEDLKWSKSRWRWLYCSFEYFKTLYCIYPYTSHPDSVIYIYYITGINQCDGHYTKNIHTDIILPSFILILKLEERTRETLPASQFTNNRS